MKFISTLNPNHQVSLAEAVIKSLAPDGGLYLPAKLNPLPASFWQSLPTLSFSEIGFQCAKNWLGDSLPEEDLQQIIEQSLNFDAPLREIRPGFFVLELFHGPTLAFKDFGARFMARLMSYLNPDPDHTLTVLVATSGDTGGAVASAFHRVPGVEVIILFPAGKVSPLQEKQLTTLGDNITAIEVDGTFDDCQRLVKSAFRDEPLNQHYRLTSANSINISRLLPQSFYYLRALQQLPPNSSPAFVVPSGNFGNLTAGMMAAEAGMPAAQFIAATNANRVVPDYLATGHYQPKPSIATISNAMDVGDPSNLPRLEAILGNHFPALQAKLIAESFTDQATRNCIQQVSQHHKYLMCPHTAVGWLAAESYHRIAPQTPKVILATAHPAKFIETITSTLNLKSIPIPERLGCLADLPSTTHHLSSKFEDFSEFLLSR